MARPKEVFKVEYVDDCGQSCNAYYDTQQEADAAAYRLEQSFFEVLGVYEHELNGSWRLV